MCKCEKSSSVEAVCELAVVTVRLHGAEVVKVDEDVTHVHHNMVQKTKKKDCTITKLHKQVLHSKQSERFPL